MTVDDVVRTSSPGLARLDPGARRHLLHRLQLRRVPERWLPGPSPTSTELGMDLFCLPYAGAGASTYHRWRDPSGLPERIHVRPVQLPGREERLGEAPYRRAAELVEDFLAVLLPSLHRPFALFGHSMGALLAYEIACALRDRGAPQPQRLLLSAFRAPHRPSSTIRIHHLPDEVLKIALARDGIPLAVLQDESLMRALLPTLRADLELCDAYVHHPRPPLDVPISVFGGCDDVRVPPSELEGWREHTTAGSDLTVLPGGHLYLHAAADRLLHEVHRRLDSPSDAPATCGGDAA